MKNENVKLMLGDNIEKLRELPDNFVDSIITDPPYGLSFMNKKWDYDVPSIDFWKEALRVLKPGGHVLSFGGTRTYHRMVVNMEDAGFEIRDQIMWVYGSGFPKSHNIGKAVDKIEGNEREVVGYVPQFPDGTRGATYRGQANNDNTTNFLVSKDTSTNGLKPVYKKNNDYEGWGTALKPANEPICVARKPISEKTIAENVLRWGTGGINIDGCRIGTDDKLQKLVNDGNKNLFDNSRKEPLSQGKKIEFVDAGEGRFPANFIIECTCDEVIPGNKGEVKKSNGRVRENHKYNSVGNMGSYDGEGTIDNYNDKGDIHTNPDCPCRLLDEQSGILKGVVGNKRISGPKQIFNETGTSVEKQLYDIGTPDSGGASRFFYVAKVSKKERNMGLDNFEEKTSGGKGHGLDRRCSHCNTSMLKPEDCKCEEPDWITPPKKNTHPTIKPINLLTYLVRLITPPNGIVMDCYMGSGSTGIAALLEGFQFIGMEMDEQYFNIAEARIDSWEQYKDLIKKK
jgi:site-specific DNA-methyltransferase (adenine-specific)